jgi:hypothetical protein
MICSPHGDDCKGANVLPIGDRRELMSSHATLLSTMPTALWRWQSASGWLTAGRLVPAWRWGSRR